MRDALATELPDEEQRPLWVPEDQIPQDAIDSSAALAAGLTFRSAEETARGTLGTELDRELAAGFSPELERSLLSRVRR